MASRTKIKCFTGFESEVGHLEKTVNDYLDKETEYILDNIKQNVIVKEGGTVKIYLTVILTIQPFSK